MSNVLSAREPSMDEILASIRRIIESGEERQNQAAARPNSEEADSSPTMLLSAANAPVSRGSAARPVSRAPETPDLSNEAVTEPAESRTDSVRETVESTGDVLQRLRRSTIVETTIDDPIAEAAAAPDARSDTEEIPGAFMAAEHADATEAASIAPLVSPASQADRFDPLQFDGEFNEQDFAAELLETVGLIRGAEEVSLREVMAQSVAAASDRKPEDASSPPQPAEASTAAMDPLGLGIVTEEPRRGSVLVSAEASDQIAASFEDLARVVREEHLRVMDQTIDQMLRPMLQDWLDDNLPGIVERLVREEIERVARGRR